MNNQLTFAKNVTLATEVLVKKFNVTFQDGWIQNESGMPTDDDSRGAMIGHGGYCEYFPSFV